MIQLPDTCPCGPPEHPRAPRNPPGRSVIDYRVGDFISFRHALLRSRAGETALAAWRPRESGDLGLQLVEWWAYLADILALYNERIAHQAYLRTADQPDALRTLIRLLGYRPRPGIGASAVLAALAGSARPVALPRGFQVQSKPGPGKPPQVFELDAGTVVEPPGAVPFDPPPLASFLDGVPSVLLAGAVASVRPGDQVLVLERGWDQTKGWTVARASGAVTEKDPRGAVNTRLTFEGPLTLPDEATAAGYQVLRGGQPAYLWQLTNAASVTGTTLDLEGVVRQIHPGDPVLLQAPGAQSELLFVTGYQELVWYANAPDSTKPEVPPAVGAIPILHSRISFAVAGSLDVNAWLGRRSQATLLYGWREVARLLPEPASSLPQGIAVTVTATRGGRFPDPPSTSPSYPLLIEDATGAGAAARGTPSGDRSRLQLQPVTAAAPLRTPLRGLFNLLQVSRGESVASEVLGSGDASQVNQEFQLQKSPLTYLPDPLSSSGQGYRSTLRVWVDGLEWHEVPSFFGQAPNAKVFVTREDEDSRTHVLFGDRVHGAGLPTGAGNVVASYRIGSGADAPAVGTLSVILKPQPGLQSLRNPVPAGGGADPDPPEQIRRYAPRSVMTFGRAVSGLDYETIAAQTPGVARARVYWSWDASEQRNLVKVYVGDDGGAVTAAGQALKGAEDPNRPVQVLLAEPIRDPDLNVRVEPLPGRRVLDVREAVRAALFDDDSGLFGGRNVRIGQSVYQSQIVAACMTALGVAAVHFVEFSTAVPAVAGVRWDPGEGRFFAPDPRNLWVDVEGA